MSAYVKRVCGSGSLIAACLETTLDYYEGKLREAQTGNERVRKRVLNRLNSAAVSKTIHIQGQALACPLPTRVHHFGPRFA